MVNRQQTQAGRMHVLSPEEAAVWGRLQLGYSWQALTGLPANLLDLEAQPAEARLDGIPEAWQSAGLLKGWRCSPLQDIDRDQQFET